MRYPKDQKERTRRHIVETVSEALRRNGIAGSNIVPLMKEAGLTQGAFYKNFASRDELLVEALVHAIGQTRRLAMQWAVEARTRGQQAIGKIIDEYLSERHLNSLNTGCAMAALGPELWRQSEPVRRAVFAASTENVEVIALELPHSHRGHARAIYMLMAGALSSARLAGTRQEQLQILKQAREAARLLAGLTPTKTSLDRQPPRSRVRKLT